MPPGFSVTGKWDYSSIPGADKGSASIFSKDPNATVVWNPQLQGVGGDARVSLYIVSHPGNDKAAIFEVVCGGATHTLPVDLTSPAGWLTIGTFHFTGSGEEFLRLRQGTPGADLRAAGAKIEFVNPGPNNLWSGLTIDNINIYDRAALAPKPRPFTDIQGHWAEREINALHDEGILEGVSPSEFKPDDTLNAATVRTAAGKISGKLVDTPAVLAVFKKLGDTISPENLVRTFIQAARVSGKNLDWAKPADHDALSIALAYALLDPGQKDKFIGASATRAQAAVLLRHFQENIVQAGPPIDSKWRLTFMDDFKGTALDGKMWASQNGNSWGKLLSARYPENIVVGDGLMHIVTRKENRGGKAWTTGYVWTKGFRQCYGYWEACYRYAAAYGLNQAFWMNPAVTPVRIDPKDQGHFEIDVNEGHYPNVVNSTLHQEGVPSATTRYVAPADLSQDFHVYGCAWSKQEVVYYVDGTEVARKPNVVANTTAPVIFSTAVLPAWAGPVTDALNGKSMDVAWVHVFLPKSP